VVVSTYVDNSDDEEPAQVVQEQEVQQPVEIVETPAETPA
jgi:hypothetical protein